MALLTITVLLSAILPLGVRVGTAWQMKKAPLMTRWTDSVDPANPLPEYPRPHHGLQPRSKQTEWTKKLSQKWKNTRHPPGEVWMKMNFNDSSWDEGKGHFGAHVAEGIGIDPSRIWLRRVFNPGVLSAEEIAKLVIPIHHGDDVEVCLNGVPAFKEKDRSTQFVTRTLTPEGRKAITPNSGNVLAVSCKLAAGKPIIDAGILLREPSAASHE